MGYPLALALRYLSSKKRAFVSVGTAFAILGVTLGVAALAIVVSVTGGFKQQFKDKVLGVNAHVLVLKYSIDFREYRDVMKKVSEVPGVTGVAPFIINAMMITHGERTATGVLLKGVDPTVMGTVLDLPKQVRVQEDRRAAGPQLFNNLAHQQSTQRVKTRGRFIEKYQFRHADQCLRQADALNHPLAELTQLSVLRILEMYPCQKLIDPALKHRPADTLQPAVRAQKFARRETVVKAEMLRQKAYSSAGRPVRQWCPEHRSAAPRRLDQPQQHLD